VLRPKDSYDKSTSKPPSPTPLPPLGERARERGISPANQSNEFLGRHTNRLLKNSASGVLAALRSSTLSRNLTEVGSSEGVYPFAKNYSKGERPARSVVCTSSPLRLLRPCWTAFLNSLRAILIRCVRSCDSVSQSCQNSFSTTCWCGVSEICFTSPPARPLSLLLSPPRERAGVRGSRKSFQHPARPVASEGR
jgi:hypothetical protein